MERLTPVYTTPELRMEQAVPVEAGHMMYRKYIVPSDQGPLFVKAFDPTMFTRPEARDHTREHLEHEAAAYEYLKDQGYPHLPEYVAYRDDSLVLSACLPADGWHWELPNDPELNSRYITDVLAALIDLENLPSDGAAEQLGDATIAVLYQRGWARLCDVTTRHQVQHQFERFGNDFHAHSVAGAQLLQEMLADDTNQLAAIAATYVRMARDHLAHFDARQSNIAWHPDKGVRLVDWSWASLAPASADRTMFIIDLFKSGYNVLPLLERHFDPHHAVLQIGHWLARSIEPTATSDTTVRFHQLAAAASAATLLLAYDANSVSQELFYKTKIIKRIPLFKQLLE